MSCSWLPKLSVIFDPVTPRNFMKPTASDEPKFVKLEMEVVEMEAQPHQAQRRFAIIPAVNKSCCL